MKARYVATGEIPPLKAMIDDPVIKNDQKASAVAIQSARAVAMPGIPEMGEVWGPANAALELSLTGAMRRRPRLITRGETDHDADRSDAGQQSVIHRHVKSPSGRGTSRL